LSLLGVIFAPEILSVIAPDMQESTALMSATLLRIMFPLIVFAAASYTLVGVLQSCGRFIAPAFISAVSNILVIVYFLFLNDTQFLYQYMDWVVDFYTRY
jgi:putative peptidoglycan lipid II flippase